MEASYPNRFLPGEGVGACYVGHGRETLAVEAATIVIVRKNTGAGVKRSVAGMGLGAGGLCTSRGLSPTRVSRPEWGFACCKSCRTRYDCGVPDDPWRPLKSSLVEDCNNGEESWRVLNKIKSNPV